MTPITGAGSTEQFVSVRTEAPVFTGSDCSVLPAPLSA